MSYVVLCMKWGRLYGPDYVNVLCRAVADNLTVRHRFVCLTDDAEGLLPEIETYPLPDPHLADAFTRKGGWPKLTVFGKDVHGLSGRCLFVDLDSVILGDLTPMLEHPGEIVVIREWRRLADYFRPWGRNGMTSTFAFTFGQSDYLFEQWCRDPQQHLADLRSEQRFVTAYARDLRFWPDDWVISFKRHLMAPPILNRFVPPRRPPPEARFLAFHGDPRPIDVVLDKGQVWGKPLRYGRGAVPFVRDYWLRYGGTDPG